MPSSQGGSARQGGCLHVLGSTGKHSHWADAVVILPATPLAPAVLVVGAEAMGLEHQPLACDHGVGFQLTSSAVRRKWPLLCPVLATSCLSRVGTAAFWSLSLLLA